MTETRRRFFTGASLEQAVMQAARYHQVEPEELAYTEVEKRHGFLRVRRRVVVEVDPDHPRRSPAPEEVAPAPEAPSPPAAEPAPPARTEAAARGERAGPPPGRGRPGGAPPRERRQPEARRERREERPRVARAGGRPTEGAEGAEMVTLPEAPRRAIERYPRAEGAVAMAAEKALALLLGFAGLELESAILQGEERLEIELWGADEERLLAGHGEGLLAVEHLLPRLIRGFIGESVPVRVDCAGFHDLREEQLRNLAQRTAERVRARGRPHTLEPMNPAERRIIHTTLSDDAGVTTESRGEGYLKRVVIKPA